jgi:hypothetical protein
MPLPKQPLIGLTGLRRLVVAELVLHRIKECGAKAGIELFRHDILRNFLAGYHTHRHYSKSVW